MALNQSFMASQSHSSFLNDSVGRSAGTGGSGAGGAAEPGTPFAGGKKEQVWCEQAVWSLLNVYEEKWRQLDWGNLKGKHWEEVSASLNSYGSGQWPAKSPMQCKNKIEDMKKKYKEKLQRGGSLACSSSGGGGGGGGGGLKWPYFSRMEVMFKNAAKGAESGHGLVGGALNEQMNLAGCVRLEQEFEDNENEEMYDEGEESEEEEVSFNVNSSSKRKLGAGPGSNVNCSKQRRSSVNEMVGVVRALGEALVRIESSKLEGQRQLIQMQAQADIRRVEMELKRTEMFLSAQVQLAKLVAESMKNNN